MIDEYSIAAFYIGHPEIAFERTTSIVNSLFFPTLHIKEQERLERNLEFFKRGMEEAKKKNPQPQKV
jgi:hypothetical protein